MSLSSEYPPWLQTVPNDTICVCGEPYHEHQLRNGFWNRVNKRGVPICPGFYSREELQRCKRIMKAQSAIYQRQQAEKEAARHAEKQATTKKKAARAKKKGEKPLSAFIEG